VQKIAEGRSTKEVATELGISVKTAETHRTNLMRKTPIALRQRDRPLRHRRRLIAP